MGWARKVYELVIREHHLDTFGHVNNATYLEILEEARWQFITEGGYGFREVHELKQGPVILELHLQLRKELTLREKITIETQLVDYQGKIGTMVQEIKNEAGDVCARMEMKFGLFDLQTRKLIAPTERWLRAAGHG